MSYVPRRKADTGEKARHAETGLTLDETSSRRGVPRPIMRHPSSRLT